MTREVAQSQFGQCLVGGQVLGLRRSFVDQGVGVLFTVQRAAADCSIQLGVHQDVGEAKVSCNDSGALERFRELLAGKKVPFLQDVDKKFVGLGQHQVVKLLLAVHVGIEGIDAMSGGLKHPTYVRRQDEMPGRPQDVSPEYRSVVERSIHCCIAHAWGTLGDRPFGRAVVLGLYCAQPFDDFLGRLEAGA